MDDASRAEHAHPYTVQSGFAAADLVRDAVMLEIIIPSKVPNTAYGGLGIGQTTATTKLKDSRGNTLSATTTSANHFVCEWMGESNLRYPPLVRKGEPVEVIQYVGQDKKYWRTTGKGRDFRTTDRLVFEVGATDPTKPGVAKTDLNTYMAYIDSDQKKIGFKTSKVNGEPCAMAFEADLAAGTWCFSDDTSETGNRFFLDTGSKSGTPEVQINLNSGSTFMMDKENGYIKIPKKFTVDSGERIVFNSPIINFNLSQAGSFIINAANIAINASTDLVMNIGNVFGINASSSKFSGTVIMNAIRTPRMVIGALNTLYQSIVLSDPKEGTVTTPSNPADTDTSAAGDRTACAAEQFAQAMSTITSLFGQAKVSAGSALTDIGQAAPMKNIKGDAQ